MNSYKLSIHSPCKNIKFSIDTIDDKKAAAEPAGAPHWRPPTQPTFVGPTVQVRGGGGLASLMDTVYMCSIICNNLIGC